MFKLVFNPLSSRRLDVLEYDYSLSEQ